MAAAVESFPYGPWCEEHDFAHRMCPECGKHLSYPNESIRRQQAAEKVYFAHMREVHPEVVNQS